MKTNYFSLLFFIRKTRLLKNGEAPISLRITVNGKRAEMQLSRSIEVSNWNQAKECAISKDARSKELNYYLESIRTKIFSIQREMQMDDKVLTPQSILNRFKGNDDSKKMLLEVFREHNKQCRELLDKDFVLGTVLRYERTVTYLEELIQKNFQVSDVPIKDIDNAFIRNFEHYVKTQKGCAQNAATKYLKNLKKITKQALANNWISVDPFKDIKFSVTNSNRDFLLEDEVKLLLEKEFTVKRLEKVRDIFVFCCFTGLAFTDVQNLRKEHIFKDNFGEWWIRKPREKTNTMSQVPLMDIPMKILEKYKNDDECVKEVKLLPVPSNQRMNSYLTEIADVCSINKKLTTHVARHSFACIALANGVSIEVISKMLGHTDTKTTKIYAKMVDKTISKEMQVLREKFAV